MHTHIQGLGVKWQDEPGPHLVQRKRRLPVKGDLPRDLQGVCAGHEQHYHHLIWPRLVIKPDAHAQLHLLNMPQLTTSPRPLLR